MNLPTTQQIPIILLLFWDVVSFLHFNILILLVAGVLAYIRGILHIDRLYKTARKPLCRFRFYDVLPNCIRISMALAFRI